MGVTCPVCQQEVDEDQEICKSCGFRIQGSTQKFEPISVIHEKETTADEKLTGARLKVIRGPQTGISYQLYPEKTTLGRSPDCTIFLNDMTVSRVHATIEPLDNTYVISDDNSFNGVWINNKSIESKALEPGDILQIGTFCLVYEQD